MAYNSVNQVVIRHKMNIVYKDQFIEDGYQGAKVLVVNTLPSRPTTSTFGEFVFVVHRVHRHGPKHIQL